MRAVVAVHDARRPLLGDARRQQVVQLVHARVVQAGRLDRGRPRAVPRTELAGDVPVVPSELGQPDVGRVEGVQRCEHVDERLARPPARRLVEPRDDFPRRVERRAVDLAHDVEVGLGDVAVFRGCPKV